MNVQARNNAVFFAAVQNAMGQGVASWGATPGLNQQVQNFAQLTHDFNQGAQNFNNFFGQNWGQLNRPGFLSPLANNPMSNPIFAQRNLPGAFRGLNNGLNGLNNANMALQAGRAPGQAGAGFPAQFGMGVAGAPAQAGMPTQGTPGLPGAAGQGQVGQMLQQNNQMIQQLLGMAMKMITSMMQQLQGLMGAQQGVQNKMAPRLPNQVRPPAGQPGALAQNPAFCGPKGQPRARGAAQQAGMGALTGADQKVADLINKKSGKGWLTNHGSYKKTKDGFQFTKGELAGYTAQRTGKGAFAIQNKEGQKVGEYKAPKGQDKVASPVAFDLNGDGRIGTTGETTAKDRLEGTQMGRTVNFDIDGDGKKDQIEWLNGSGDGMLVDNSDGNAAHDMNGKRLFGDEGGKYENGYQKLAMRDRDGDGVLRGEELEGLQMWVDNGDAEVQDGELRDLAGLGITEVNVRKDDVKNERGETLMRSNATTANGQNIMTEDVWFGKK